MLLISAAIQGKGKNWALETEEPVKTSRKGIDSKRRKPDREWTPISTNLTAEGRRVFDHRYTQMDTK